jgi:TrmH RNA methyltransferase
VYGLSAALAAFEQRPESVLSIAHTPAARRSLARMLSEAARRRIAYREVDDEALAQMAESVHHEGVCLLMRPRPVLSPLAIAQSLGQRGLVLALDDVQNPHNIGAILRSAAFFGAHALLVGGDKAGLTPSARRVAEGGAERVAIARTPDLRAALRTFADEGLTIVGSDARAQTSVHGFRWPRRSVLVLGHEQRGLSPEIKQGCQTLLRIPTPQADPLDSLNVSVSAGILLSHWVGDSFED